MTITQHNSYYGVTKTRTNESWNTEYYHQVIQHPVWYCDQCYKYFTNHKLAHEHHTQATTASPSTTAKHSGQN